MENPYQVINDKLDSILSRIEALENKPVKIEKISTKDRVLTFKEATQFVSLSESYMRQLCHRKAIPYYNPRGRRIYFKEGELNEWLSRNRYDEIKQL